MESNDALNLLAAVKPQQLGAFVLVFARIMTMFCFAPILGANAFSIRFRIGLAILISIVIFPLFEAENTLNALSDPMQFGSMLLGEIGIGLTHGISLLLMFHSIQLGGNLIAQLCGTRLPTLAKDPATNETLSPIAQFYSVLALLIFISMNGHRKAISGLLDSFHHLPIGEDHFQLGFLEQLTMMLGLSFEFGLRFAAPILLACFLTTLAMGIASRGIPHFNLMETSFTLNSLIALVIMIGIAGSIEFLIEYYQEVQTDSFQLFYKSHVAKLQ